MNPEQLDALVHELVDAVRPIAQTIEASPHLTMDHYDQYLSAIHRIVEGLGTTTQNRAARLAVGAALIRAGASRPGVNAALDILSD